MAYSPHEGFEHAIDFFIRNEVEAGIAFASVAANSKTEEKRLRTCRKARKAYDTAMRFWGKYPSSGDAAHDILFARTAKLRHLLLRLGETPEE